MSIVIELKEMDGLKVYVEQAVKLGLSIEEVEIVLEKLGKTGKMAGKRGTALRDVLIKLSENKKGENKCQ